MDIKMEQHLDHQTGISVKTINVPLMNVLFIGIWIVGSTISIVWQFTNLQFTLTKLENSVKVLDEKFSDRVSSIAKEIDLHTVTQWTRRDQEYWCSKTEQQNQNWKCGSFPEVSPYVPTSKEYWKSGKLEMEAKHN